MRYLAVDLARGVGLLAVFYAHTAPVTGDSPFILKALNGAENVAAPLFTLMLGVSFGLMAKAERADEKPREFALRMLVRAALLIAFGVLAVLSGAAVIPILQYFGVVTLVLILVRPLRARWILLFAAIMAMVSPVLMVVVGEAVTQWTMAGIVESGRVPDGYPVVVTLTNLLFTGYGYRVTGLLVFALVGLAVAKAGVDRSRTLVATSLGGVVACVVGYGGARLTGITAAPYSGTIVELVGATGLALLVLSVCGWLVVGADRTPPIVGTRPLLWLVTPVRALGTMTLTFYLLHIAVLAIWARTQAGVPDDNWPMVIGLSVGSLVLATVWWRWLGKGPVERLMSFATFGIRR